MNVEKHNIAGIAEICESYRSLRKAYVKSQKFYYQQRTRAVIISNQSASAISMACLKILFSMICSICRKQECLIYFVIM